jgi:uncharacterized protein
MVLQVTCPTCQGKLDWSPASRFRPFCSERCRLIDLGAWAAEKYSVPVEAIDPEQDLDPSKN